MIAPLVTLVFLVSIWALVVVGAAILERNGDKIAAALKGTFAPRQMLVPIRVRTRSRLQRPMRATARRRAAA